jgi:hypothetical protein
MRRTYRKKGHLVDGILVRRLQLQHPAVRRDGVLVTLKFAHSVGVVQASVELRTC